MSEKFQNKYRIGSHRKPGWDYSSDGHYFITLVVQNRHEVLGRIENHEMKLNTWGEIVLDEWIKSFKMRAELFCDAFVIMPNHIHAIVTIDNMMGMDTIGAIVETHGRAFLQPSTSRQPFTSQRIVSQRDKSQSWERKPKSISSFVAGFKSAINTAIDNAIDGGCDLFPHLGKFNRDNHFWQPNYHDHIIRDAQSYAKISNYIATNPANWAADKINGNE
jgi:putative transposase